MSGVQDRVLQWDGLLNGRELGGIPTAHGPVLTRGLVRSASVHTLSSHGWTELLGHGIRTVIDLRHPWEVKETAPADGSRPNDVALIRQPVEPAGYVETWTGREDRWKLSSPHYFAEFMAEHSTLVADAIRTVALAQPGGVLVHCYAGKDRAGLTIAMLLDLLGTDHELIIADHWISFDRPRSLEAELGKTESPGKPPPNKDVYAQVMKDLLTDYPAASCFASQDDADQVRANLVDRLCRTAQ